MVHPNEVTLVRLVDGQFRETPEAAKLFAEAPFFSAQDDALIEQFQRQMLALGATIAEVVEWMDPCDCGDCGSCGWGDDA
jgi:hypothetical protein